MTQIGEDAYLILKVAIDWFLKRDRAPCLRIVRVDKQMNSDMVGTVRSHVFDTCSCFRLSVCADAYMFCRDV